MFTDVLIQLERDTTQHTAGNCSFLSSWNSRGLHLSTVSSIIEITISLLFVIFPCSVMYVHKLHWYVWTISDVVEWTSHRNYGELPSFRSILAVHKIGGTRTEMQEVIQLNDVSYISVLLVISGWRLLLKTLHYALLMYCVIYSFISIKSSRTVSYGRLQLKSPVVVSYGRLQLKSPAVVSYWRLGFKYKRVWKYYFDHL